MQKYSSLFYSRKRDHGVRFEKNVQNKEASKAALLLVRALLAAAALFLFLITVRRVVDSQKTSVWCKWQGKSCSSCQTLSDMPLPWRTLHFRDVISIWCHGAEEVANAESANGEITPCIPVRVQVQVQVWARSAFQIKSNVIGCAHGCPVTSRRICITIEMTYI